MTLGRRRPMDRTKALKRSSKRLGVDPVKLNEWKNRSRKPIRPRSEKREAEVDERQALVREQLRLYPVCQAQIPFGCTKIATEVNEIIRRGQWRAGYLEPSNTETLCHNCHAWITVHPDWAKHHGHQLEGFVRDLENFHLHRRSARDTRRSTLGCDTTCTDDHRNPTYAI